MGVKTNVTVSKSAMAIGVLVASAVLAHGSSAAGAGPKTRDGANPAKRICKMSMPTGSRLVQRVCRTKEEWDYNEKKIQDSLLQNQIDGMIRPVPDQNAPGIDRKLGGADG